MYSPFLTIQRSQRLLIDFEEDRAISKRGGENVFASISSEKARAAFIPSVFYTLVPCIAFRFDDGGAVFPSL